MLLEKKRSNALTGRQYQFVSNLNLFLPCNKWHFPPPIPVKQNKSKQQHLFKRRNFVYSCNVAKYSLFSKYIQNRVSLFKTGRRGKCIDTVPGLSVLSILQAAFSADSKMRYFSSSKKELKYLFSSIYCPCPSGKTSCSVSSLWRQLGMPTHSVELLCFLPSLHLFRRIYLARRKKIICLLHMGLQRSLLWLLEGKCFQHLSSQYLWGSLYPRKEFCFSKTKKLLARASSCSHRSIRLNLLPITKFHSKNLWIWKA